MATQYLSRDAWTTSGPAQALVPMSASEVRGVAFHWPGTASVIGDPGARSIANRLEGYRRYHVSGRGWSDIAYQVAIDQGGRVWTLRGITYRSAANGNSAVNREYGACLLMLGMSERPEPAMLQAIHDWYRDRWVAHYGTGRARVVGHREIRPSGTECPGDIVQALINKGILTKGIDMPTVDEIWNADRAPVSDPQNTGGGRNHFWQMDNAIGKTLDLSRATRRDVLALKTQMAANAQALSAIIVAVQALSANDSTAVQDAFKTGVQQLKDELANLQFSITEAMSDDGPEDANN